MNTKQTLIAIQMGCDTRLPANAFGYVADLSPESSPSIIADRLNMLSRYVPELVEEYRAAENNMKPSLKKLNENDNPAELGGEKLGNDGQGNELWLFRSLDRVANRYENEDGEVEWSADIEGWNYQPGNALE